MKFNKNAFGKNLLNIIMSTVKPKLNTAVSNLETLVSNTDKSIRDDLTAAIAAATSGQSVKTIVPDANNNTLTVQYTDSTADKVIDLNSLVTDIHLEGATLDVNSNVLTLKSANGGTDVTVDLSDFVNSSELESALATKADKVEGKGLSTNDFTDAMKTEVTTNKVKDLDKNDSGDKLIVTYMDNSTKEIELSTVEGDDPTQADSDSAWDNAA